MISKVMDIIKFIGDDPDRPGLKDTPFRVTNTWRELYSGYNIDPKEVLTTFDEGVYTGIIVLKDCEFYSTCEHHMLPFFGKAHIAYIPPQDGKVIGVSKLARLLEIFSRRLQIQERIGDQIVDFLIENLQCIGAACILEAQHMCMTMRGVNKQNSIMTTSSMRGIFLSEVSARLELMSLIK